MDSRLTLVLVPRPGSWVELRGLAGRLLTAVRFGVKPAYRSFDMLTRAWCVHTSRVAYVCDLAVQYGFAVDDSLLSREWQLAVQNKSVPASVYATLHLLPTASLELVQAAYRCLAKTAHPDTGGSTEAFLTLQNAYNAICKSRIV